MKVQVLSAAQVSERALSPGYQAGYQIEPKPLYPILYSAGTCKAARRLIVEDKEQRLMARKQYYLVRRKDRLTAGKPTYYSSVHKFCDSS